MSTAPTAMLAPVGKHTAHYLDVIEKFREDPERSYHYHHLMINFQILGPFDAGKFEAAIRKLAKVQPAFRLSFQKAGPAWTQKIGEEPLASFVERKTFGADITNWREKTRELIIAENEIPFRMTGEPLIKFTILEFPSHNAAVFLTKFHHIVCDGWGILVALSQLLALYEAELQGVNAPAPAMQPTDYLAIAAAENAFLASKDGEKRMAWWRKYLADHAFIQKPLPERPQGRLALCADHLSFETSAKLFKIAEQKGVHFSYLIHAAFTKALSTWTKSDDVLVTFVKANRNDANSAVVGNFADWVTVRHQLDLKAPLGDIAKAAEHDVNKAKENYLPYWHIVEQVCPHQYFNDFGITPYSFDFMPEFNPKIDFGGKASFLLLRDLEVFPFRLTATDIFCRTTLVGDLDKKERKIEIFLIYHGGYLKEDQVRGVLNEMKAALEGA
jgi:hypothetical protein